MVSDTARSDLEILRDKALNWQERRAQSRQFIRDRIGFSTDWPLFLVQVCSNHWADASEELSGYFHLDNDSDLPTLAGTMHKKKGLNLEGPWWRDFQNGDEIPRANTQLMRNGDIEAFTFLKEKSDVMPAPYINFKWFQEQGVMRGDRFSVISQIEKFLDAQLVALSDDSGPQAVTISILAESKDDYCLMLKDSNSAKQVRAAWSDRANLLFPPVFFEGTENRRPGFKLIGDMVLNAFGEVA